MCQPISTTGLRCSTHARERLTKAKASGNPERIAVAKHEYELTNVGIQELRDNGNDFAADLRQGERNTLVRNSKAKKARQQAITPAQRNAETYKALDDWNSSNDEVTRKNYYSQYEPHTVLNAAISDSPTILNDSWTIVGWTSNLEDGKLAIELDYEFYWSAGGAVNETRDAELEAAVDNTNFIKEPTQEEAQEVADAANKSAEDNIIADEFADEEITKQYETRQGILASISQSSGISEGKLSRITSFTTTRAVFDEIKADEVIWEWNERNKEQEAA